MLALRTEKTPEAEAFRFGNTGYSYAWLSGSASRLAGRLHELEVGKGIRVLIALPNGPEFFTALFGVVSTGATAVPVYPGADVDHWVTMLGLADARLLLVPSGSKSLLPPPVHPVCIELPLSPDHPATQRNLGLSSEPDADDVAVLQFTSGSTSDPKGVQLTHDNLLTNVRQMTVGMALTAEDVFVTWLPTYHDMGLVLMTLSPLALGARLVVLPTSLRSVHPWLEAIREARGTFTAAPDSAYRLVLRAVRSPESHDLSSLRVALNAAEPVRVSTITDFERSFGLRNVMAAGYGLAEATVGVSMTTPGETPGVDAHGHVSVGRPFPGIEIRIEGERRACAAGEVGEIIVRSRADTSGYFRNESATRALFTADGAIRTGDLGYLGEDGALTIVGRKKNLIIQAGRSIYPADVEELVEGLPEVRTAAAVGLELRPGTGEQLVVLLETRSHAPPPAEVCRELVITVVEAIQARFGLRPARVFLVKPKTIPFTRNGKKRHLELRRRLVEESLHDQGCILYPPW